MISKDDFQPTLFYDLKCVTAYIAAHKRSFLKHLHYLALLISHSFQVQAVIRFSSAYHYHFVHS